MQFQLQDELQALQDIPNYPIPEEHDVESMDPAAVDALLEGAVQSVADSSDAITDPHIFDVYRSLLKYADHLAGNVLSGLLDSITSALQAELDATTRDIDTDASEAIPHHREPMEKFAFLLLWFVIVAERNTSASDVVEKPKKGKGSRKKARTEEWNWEDQIPATLGLISKVLRLKTHRIWITSTERDTFINCLTRPAYVVSESEQHMKVQNIKLSMYKVVCLAVKHHAHSLLAQISIMQSLQYYEHLSEPMAEMLTILAKEFDHSQLAEEILREISTKEFNAQDPKGPRSFSKYLIKLAELSPRLVLKQISVLLRHLDSESYPMRMALVEIIGLLIREIASSEEGELEAREKQINGFFELLNERFRDLSSYVRAKVINTMAKLLDLPHKFPKERLTMTTWVIAALEDKASSVRRYAIALLTKLILTHPYGLMHGGLLNLADWETRYKEVAEELQKIEASELEQAKADGQGGDDDDDEEEGDEGSDEEEEEAGDETVRMDENGESIPPTPATMKSMRSKKSRSRKSSMPSMATARGSSVSFEDPSDSTAQISTIDEEEDEDEGEGDTTQRGDKLIEEDEEMEDFTQQFDEQEGVPQTTKTVRQGSPTSTVRNPRTPARSRVPRTPKTTQSTMKKPKKKSKKNRKTDGLVMSTMTNEQAALAALQSNQLLHLRLRKRYYAEALAFIRHIEGAMDTLQKLLVSTSKAEVLESMEFFRVAHEYQFQSAQGGIKKMLHLIWSKDNSSTSEDGKELKGIRSRLIECYRNLYFDPLPDMDAKQQINRITRNMIQLTFEATLAELTSLEELMRTMMEDHQIHQDVVSKLWQVYSSDKDIPKAQRRGAIIILGMLAIANRSVVSQHVETLIKVGLGARGKADATLARYTCIALQRLNGSVKKVKGSLSDKSLRLPMDNPIFTKLKDAIEYPCRRRDWFGMAEQAINCIYLLADRPDLLCDKIIKLLTRRVFGKKQSTPMDVDLPDATQDDSGDVTMASGASAPSIAPQNSSDSGDAFELAQLIFFVGHVAIKHIVFLELVEREWKHQKDVKTSAAKHGKTTGAGNTAKDGEELDQVAGNAEDEIGERIAAIRETELLYSPNSLLTAFGPMIVKICRSPNKYKSQILRTAAVLSFSKFLCVSSQFCDEHHRLLFKILETSRDPDIRSNVVIALGDIAVCFSTIIDENSNELYKGLSDEDLVVKKNTLMVLTHLILNGMVKVKGQLGEMAKCLEDPDQRIADLAKLFFSELSTKENAIYNNLPDVISHLSVGEHAVDEEVFQSTMKYIFGFIEKEKQAENIVEKLCQRFRLVDDPRQWRDIAFCLSLLPFKSERSVKKLIDGLPFYQDKLHEEAVYSRFNEILQKARSNKSANKPDTELKEFESILTDFKEKGMEDEALEKRVEVKKAAAKKRATRRSECNRIIPRVSHPDLTSAQLGGRRRQWRRQKTLNNY
ncbi:hypothetical protein SISSUDRAFT_988305 [Sistotremastrum suecicum HHB10207 ss-3]|uniref:Condensin complex subunit 1 n=1 Tax=Sistotremastrum suecicum HHB10207 ss-3 TaxID=1314776 RepID=A0A166C2W8_9AGAM|nr:hypothetical protein SISSUDRAFT_988305 [Sistotremastrum suecicum HHB10207 ss-3]